MEDKKVEEKNEKSISDLERIKKELEEVKKKTEEYLNNWKRSQADYINREKSLEREKESWFKFANLNLILQFLPVYEHFNEALSHLSENNKKDEWIKGLTQIKSQFESLLKNFGVEKIKTLGEKFDPQEHEVIAKEKLEGKEKNIIVKEIQSGYMMHQVVIKPAKVIISE